MIEINKMSIKMFAKLILKFRPFYFTSIVGNLKYFLSKNNGKAANNYCKTYDEKRENLDFISFHLS